MSLRNRLKTQVQFFVLVSKNSLATAYLAEIRGIQPAAVRFSSVLLEISEKGETRGVSIGMWGDK